ncbi:MAG: hypothetical protein ACRDYB_15905, partial [Acidimicrobiales bacterium]
MDDWSEYDIDDSLDEDVEAEAPGNTIIREGPAGMGDPETEWDVPELELAPVELTSDEFVLLEPGEVPETWPGLPKARDFRFGIAARAGQLVVCDGRHRSWLRMGNGAAPDHAEGVR